MVFDSIKKFICWFCLDQGFSKWVIWDKLETYVRYSKFDDEKQKRGLSLGVFKSSFEIYTKY